MRSSGGGSSPEKGEGASPLDSCIWAKLSRGSLAAIAGKIDVSSSRHWRKALRPRLLIEAQILAPVGTARSLNPGAPSRQSERAGLEERNERRDAGAGRQASKGKRKERGSVASDQATR